METENFQLSKNGELMLAEMAKFIEDEQTDVIKEFSINNDNNNEDDGWGELLVDVNEVFYNNFTKNHSDIDFDQCFEEVIHYILSREVLKNKESEDTTD